MSMLENFKYFINNSKQTLIYLIFCFKQGIKNLKYWFHIIWNDRNGDFSYVEKILLHKLKKEYIESIKFNTKYSKPVNKDKVLKSMRICINILEDRENGYENDKHLQIMFLIMSKYFKEWWD